MRTGTREVLQRDAGVTIELWKLSVPFKTYEKLIKIHLHYVYAIYVYI